MIWCSENSTTKHLRRRRKRARTRGNEGEEEEAKEELVLIGDKASSIGCSSRVMFVIVVAVALCLGWSGVCETSAVVRPTIFSDLSPGQQAPNDSSAPTSGQQAPQSAQLPSVQTSAGSPSGSNIGVSPAQQEAGVHQPTHFAATPPHHWQHHSHNNNHHHHYNQQQADGPSSQQNNNKINPLKSRFCTGLNGQKVERALGLQSFELDDFSLSASSFSNEQVRPHLARLRLDLLGGAWCPGRPISGLNSGKEWIQVRLNRSQVVTAIETQGRFALGSGKEFVPAYQVEYSRNGGRTWHKWKDIRGASIIRANEDVNTVVRNELAPPIVGANVIRILPHSNHLRTVCLRFELHGCSYDEGAPMAYETSDGVVEPRWGHLIDYTYDGVRTRASGAAQLSAGLGQLVDGVRGPDNFSLNNGFEWVGWKSMNGDVVIEFAFKTLRNFTGALFHSNNLFSSGVEVFQAVDVHYGIEPRLAGEALRDELLERQRRRRPGQLDSAPNSADSSQAPQQQQTTLWSGDILNIEYEPDKKLEASRPVTVHLKQRLANRLRFVLKFASKWILVSEAEFSSHPIELMSLASASEQFTPPLLQALEQAASYDEYVAILREHQLRRIATDAFLETFSSTSAMDSALGSLSTSSTADAILENEEQTRGGGRYSMSEQQQQDQSAGRVLVSGPSIPLTVHSQKQPFANGAFGLAPGPQPPTMLAEQPAVVPATNPLLSQPDNTINSTSRQQQQVHSASRSISLAWLLTCAVCVLCLVALVALASVRQRFRGAHSAATRRHMHHNQQPLFGPNHCGSNSSASTTSTAKNLMSDVFGLAHHQTLANNNLASYAAGSYANTNTTTNTPNGDKQNTVQRLANALGLQDSSNSSAASCSDASSSSAGSASHYNPLFAIHSNASSSSAASFRHQTNATSTLVAASGRSRNNAIGVGPLSLLRNKLAKTLKGGGAASGALGSNHRQSLFAHGQHQQRPTQRHQLLVSLKDSKTIKPNQFLVVASPQQQQQQQLIVGLNQANPLAQQQIYCSTNGYLNQEANYAPTTGDYATPEVCDLTSTAQPFNQLNRFQTIQSLNNRTQMVPSQLTAPTTVSGQQQQQNENNLIQFRQMQQQQNFQEHNYELIYGDHTQQQQQQVIAGTRTLSNLHQRKLTNQFAIGDGNSIGQQTVHSPSNSMTLANNKVDKQRAINMEQQPNNNHYYYADTEAASQLSRK